MIRKIEDVIRSTINGDVQIRDVQISQELTESDGQQSMNERSIRNLQSLLVKTLREDNQRNNILRNSNPI
jgi:hypothetical protein